MREAPENLLNTMQQSLISIEQSLSALTEANQKFGELEKEQQVDEKFIAQRKALQDKLLELQKAFAL